MKRAALLLALLAAVPAAAQSERRGPSRGYADPSAVIAAELAFARLAQGKGQWTAFRKTATETAELFLPERTNAHAWLKGRANPPVAVKWQPHEVTMSCDGSYAVTRGAWQRPGSVGQFTTIWQRQKDGGYKWVLDQGSTLKQPLPAPEMIVAKVADCPRSRTEKTHHAAAFAEAMVPSARDSAIQVGRSSDDTLLWSTLVRSDGSRRFSASLYRQGAFSDVMTIDVAAGEG